MANFHSSEQYLQLMLEDKKKHIRIISLFAITKKMSFDNYEQVNRFIGRHTRRAKELDCYTIDRIQQTMNYLDKTADYKWTLETVLKFIDEDIKKLEGEEPIITLKSGEKIYDISKLRDLEKQGKIYYAKNKWLEK